MKALVVSRHPTHEEKTLLFFKPDLAESECEPEAEKDLLKRLKVLGLRVVKRAEARPTRQTIVEHYAEHVGKPFYPALVASVSGHEIVLFVVEGGDAVKKCREMMGATDPAQAKPESFRAKWATDKTRNAIHGSATPEDAERELRIWASYLGEGK